VGDVPALDPDLAVRLTDDYDEVVAYLTAHSGLPGPRGNLELLAAAGDLLPAAHAERLRSEPDEYLRCCGVIRLAGQFAADPVTVADLLTAAASDPSWRVREAVAMAGQRIGDTNLADLAGLVSRWLADDDPLVRRAAVAAICEPRLIRTPAGAAIAIEACASATRSLLALPSGSRRAADVRTLRQALGYCWSVAVAADPPAGLPVFLALGTEDPDLEWIVRTNRTKARLKRLLPA
jgi:hypothetical protein